MKAKTKEEILEIRKKLLLRHFAKLQTVNEVIEKLFRQDLRSGRALSRGWRYYVHLNKLPSQLEKEGKLRCAGMNDKGEKLWLTRS